MKWHLKLRARSIFILTILCLISSNPASAYRGEELLSVFSSSCPGQGQWTQKALAQAQSLISALESVRDDANCASLASSVSEMQVLSSHLTTLSSLSANEKEALAYQAQVQTLLDEIATSTDATYTATLQGYLASNLSTQAYYQGLFDYETDNERQTQASTALTTLVTGTEALIGQLVAQKQCLVSYPQILTATASLVGAVSAGVAVTNPLLGLALAGGSALTAIIVEGSRQAVFASKIKNVSELTTEVEAYRCVLESMGNQWCEMVDARNLIALKSQYRKKAPALLAKGVKLLEVSTPVFTKWLSDVRAGNEASSEADSDRQSKAMERQVIVQKALSRGTGIINENRDLFASYATSKDRWRVLRQVIISITGYGTNNFSSGEGVSNPMEEINDKNYSPFYLLGIERADLPKSGDNYIPFSMLDPFTHLPKFVPDYALLETQFELWAQEARDLVTKQLDLVLRPDPLVTLSGYFERTDNKNKISPQQAVQDFLDYTEHLIPLIAIQSPGMESDGPFARLLEESRRRLSNIDDAVKRALSNDPTMPERQALETIFKEAQMEFGTGVITAHIQIPLKQIIWRELSNLGPEDANLAALFLSAENLESVISSIDGSENLTSQLDDLQRGSATTLGAIEGFAKVFGKNLNKSLTMLREEENRRSGFSAESFRTQRAGICYSLLALEVIPKGIELELCDGAQYAQPLSEGPSSPIITSKTWELPHEQRACLGRNFFRSSKIYQDMGI